MEKRMNKWRYRRVELECDRQKLATSLLILSEELMKIHSEIHMIYKENENETD